MKGSLWHYELVILEHHLDTFGHVNNAVYLEILEEARWDVITRNGFGLDVIQRTGQGPTILEVNLRFQRELRNRQRIVVEGFIESYTGKVGKLVQRIVDEQGKSCCEALFTFGLFDVKARKLVPPTPEWLTALGLTAQDYSPS